MSNNDFMNTNAGQKFGFTMRDLMAVGFRHQRVFVLTFAGILLGSIVAAFVVPPKYESITKILVKRERVDPVVSSEKTNPVMVQNSVSEEELNSEVELILSNDVLRQTVVDAGLDKHKQLLNFWPFKNTPEKQMALTVNHLKGDLKVEPLKKTDLIKITYTSSKPQQAAQVLNALNNAYIEKHLAVRRPSGQLEFFEQETERYRHDLDDAESRLKTFSEEQGGVAPIVSRDITLQKLNDFNASLESTRAEMQSTEEKINDLQKQAGSTPGRLTTQVREADNAPVLQQLKSTLMTLELKRTELLTKYQPGYRLVQEVDKQINDTKTSIAAEEAKPLREQTTDQNPTSTWINTELAKAKSDYSALQARAAATQAIVTVYTAKAHELEEKGLVQQDLLRAQKANEENYLLYLHKREEARMADALDQTRILNVAVAEQPNVPSIPTISPWLFGLVGLLLAATVSVGAVFTMEYLDPSFRTPSEVLSELNIPVLAAVPFGGNGRNGHSGNGNGNGAHRNGTRSNGLQLDSVDEHIAESESSIDPLQQ
jgi:uncharacterized protein involved in exopolysaccharide biosynthesis